MLTDDNPSLSILILINRGYCLLEILNLLQCLLFKAAVDVFERTIIRFVEVVISDAVGNLAIVVDVLEDSNMNAIRVAFEDGLGRGGFVFDGSLGSSGISHDK